MLKKKEKIYTFGIVNIKSTLNNILITLTDIYGNVLCWSSAGSAGFKGSRKNTPFAAQSTARLLISKLISFNIKKINIIIKGKGLGREPVIRTFKYLGIDILSISEQTALAYNGCRLPKKRRL